MYGGSCEIEEVELPAVGFVRRWSLHILPHGLTNTRSFGGYRNHHCQRDVVAWRCRCATCDLFGSTPELQHVLLAHADLTAETVERVTQKLHTVRRTDLTLVVLDNKSLFAREVTFHRHEHTLCGCRRSDEHQKVIRISHKAESVLLLLLAEIIQKDVR